MGAESERIVWRKRLHLVGAPESGQVTSVVRYEPNSSFPTHDHPEGEEILVLEGVFSDEHGDWPAGTYLLNPEGFRHTPFSKSGCLLFVKLRQYAGQERRHVAVDTAKLNWEPSSMPGVAHKALYQQDGFLDVMRLERWEPNTEVGIVSHERGAEFFVLDGEFSDEAGTHAGGCWMRVPAGSTHRPRSANGCTLYVKESGLPYLRSSTVAGSCLCGAVRFRVQLPSLFCGHCHCSMCRRNHGAGFVTWFAVPRAHLDLDAIDEDLRRYSSSTHGTRTFCGRCGSSLFCESEKHPDQVDVTLANLEGPIDRAPQFHFHFDSRAPWVVVSDDLPRLGGPTGTEPLEPEDST